MLHANQGTLNVVRVSRNDLHLHIQTIAPLRWVQHRFELYFSYGCVGGKSDSEIRTHDCEIEHIQYCYTFKP